MRLRRYLIPLGLLLLAFGGLFFFYIRPSQAKTSGFRTEEVKSGELVITVSATGTVEPEDVVDVGAQVAGMIKEFGVGADGKPIDYGSPVEPGTVLARIDDALFAAKVKQSEAQVESAERKVDSAKAKLDQAKAKVDQARANTKLAAASLDKAKALAVQSVRDLDRAKRLFGGAVTSSVSQADVDAAQAANDSNAAGVGVAAASLDQAKAAEIDAQAAVADAAAAVNDAGAAVRLNRALLAQDQINLSYCTIRATVKGTIIDRRVGIGQTVQSSFNTPSLFLIAKDLKRMKVWASVNEADISQVRFGQTANFTVDAYPGRTFKGKVSLVRLNATNTQNVVTYTVEVLTDNADGSLLPYMTANLKFEVSRRPDVLQVSNTALRFRPPADKIAPAAQPAGKGDGKAKGGARADRGTVWVEENGLFKPVRVKIGPSDGNMTEVLGGELKPGMKVVVGEAHAGPAEDATNPFAPNMGKGGKKQQ
jgi:HlyD family secretion protein